MAGFGLRSPTWLESTTSSKSSSTGTMRRQASLNSATLLVTRAVR